MDHPFLMHTNTAFQQFLTENQLQSHPVTEQLHVASTCSGYSHHCSSPHTGQCAHHKNWTGHHMHTVHTMQPVHTTNEKKKKKVESSKKKAKK